MDCYNVHQHNIKLCSRVGLVASTNKLCIPTTFANIIHTRYTLVHWGSHIDFKQESLNFFRNYMCRVDCHIKTKNNPKYCVGTTISTASATPTLVSLPSCIWIFVHPQRCHWRYALTPSNCITNTI